ncbi:hypothetical protein FB451DRAFT_701915 [Mycena latifolia]|nr:hypothetical protein FB451DRAFT_701915 [Mycena latifolia]
MPRRGLGFLLGSSRFNVLCTQWDAHTKDLNARDSSKNAEWSKMKQPTYTKGKVEAEGGRRKTLKFGARCVLVTRKSRPHPSHESHVTSNAFSHKQTLASGHRWTIIGDRRKQYEKSSQPLLYLTFQLYLPSVGFIDIWMDYPLAVSISRLIVNSCLAFH